MADIVQLSCPSCGSKLSPSDNTNHFACDSCGNIFMFKQTGNSISLLPVATDNPNVVGNNNVVVRISNVIPTAFEKVSQTKVLTESVEESGECPICGRLIPRTDSFRCKKCQRSFICLVHQDKGSFLCSDCKKESQSATFDRYWFIVGGIVSVEAILFGIIDENLTPFVNNFTLIPLSTIFLSYFKPIHWAYSFVFAIFLQVIALLGYILGGGGFWGNDILFMFLLFIANAIICAIVSFLSLRKKISKFKS